MGKISSIEISDFRVYENKQVFSFDNNGTLSNLIVLYAPNGYGKTSFFDAVEWGLSGKINRFERDNIHDEIMRREFANGDQILLTNRKSFLNGKKGVIKVITAEGKSLTRTVDSRKINKQDQKYDYRSGLLEGDFNAKSLSKVTNTNILTQDQIDSFLRYTSPEDKFKALSEFWPEGEAATQIYKNLNGYLRVIENDRHASIKRSAEIKKAVKTLLNTDQHIKTINVSIAELTEKSVLDFKVEPISHPVDEAVYVSLSETVMSFLKKGERQLETTIQKRTRLQELLDKHPFYIKAEADLVKEQSEFKNVEAAEKLFIDFRSSSKIYSGENEVLNFQNSQLTLYKQLLDLMDKYSVTLKSIAEQENLQTQLLRENQESLLRLTIHQKSLATLLESYNTFKVGIEALEETINTIREKYDQFQYWTNEQEKNREQLKIKEDIIAAKDLAINMVLERRRYLTGVLESGKYDELEDADSQELTKTLNDYRSYNQSLKDTVTALDKMQAAYEQSGSLDENIDKIISWGEEYVQNLDATHCPLCKTEFESVTNLLAKIRSEKVEVLKVTRQQESIKELNEKKAELSLLMVAAKELIDNYLNKAINLCNATADIHYAEKEPITGDRLNLVQSVHFASDQAQQLHQELSSYFLLDEGISEQQPEAVKDQLKRDLEALRVKEARYLSLIDFKKGLIEGTENSITINRNRTVGLENTFGLLRSDAEYQEARRLLIELRVVTKEIDKKKLTAQIDEMQAAEKKVQREVGELHAKTEKLRVQIERHPLKLREEEIAGRKLQLEHTIRALKDTIGSFQILYRSQFVADVITVETIQRALGYTLEQISSVENENRRLGEFAIQIELINENISKGKLEAEQVGIVTKLPKLESAKEQLTNAKRAAADYIDREINNYFNKDVINQIYSRIEPHPDLNMIDFTPRITDHGPKLDVKATGLTDVLNPVLYLSAGQLNVLSLSIFLAKVFETGSEIISTIFMDDPVQNLSDINILSFLDLIRSMITTYDKQLVISSHDEHFYKLIQHKLPTEDFNATYIELADFGQIKATVAG